jgi:hypothetical protein
VDDATLLARFESCALSPAELRHEEHVRVAWLCLHGVPFEDGARRFCHGLRRFAAAHGKAGLYHETITWAYLALVHERMQASGAGEFPAFAVANRDLFEGGLAALAPFYERTTLASPLARRAFLLPRLSARAS